MAASLLCKAILRDICDSEELKVCYALVVPLVIPLQAIKKAILKRSVLDRMM